MMTGGRRRTVSSVTFISMPLSSVTSHENRHSVMRADLSFRSADAIDDVLNDDRWQATHGFIGDLHLDAFIVGDVPREQALGNEGRPLLQIGRCNRRCTE